MSLRGRARRVWELRIPPRARRALHRARPFAGVALIAGLLRLIGWPWSFGLAAGVVVVVWQWRRTRWRREAALHRRFAPVTGAPSAATAKTAGEVRRWRNGRLVHWGRWVVIDRDGSVSIRVDDVRRLDNTAAYGPAILTALDPALEWDAVLEPPGRVRFRPLAPLPDVARPPEPLEADPHRVPIGLGRGDVAVAWDWLTFPHLLVAGKTRKGKSRGLIWIGGRVLAVDGELAIIDPKNEDLAGYEGHPGVLAVATKVDEAQAAIEAVLAELERRKELNAAARRAHQPPPAFKPLVLMVDEVQQLVAMDGGRPDKSECVAGMATVARTGARYRVHLVIATQRPDVKEAVPGTIRDLCDARLAVGRLGSTQASTMMFDDAAVDPVPGDAPKGRAVLACGGVPVDVQLFAVEPPEPILSETPTGEPPPTEPAGDPPAGDRPHLRLVPDPPAAPAPAGVRQSAHRRKRGAS